MNEARTDAVSREPFEWLPQPLADEFYRQKVDLFCEQCSFAHQLRERMLSETGTRLIDWVDHLAFESDEQTITHMQSVGYELDVEDEHGQWFVHHAGLFVPVCLTKNKVHRLVLGVESVDDFLAAHRISDVVLEGDRWSQMRRAIVTNENGFEFWICERQGYQGWTVPATNEKQACAAMKHYESFKLRKREFENDADGFEFAKQLIRAAIQDLGVDWTCELFFQTEREYWQRRNHAARVQKARQDRLGLGWDNHDHHTYRSGRSAFKSMIEVFELLGFHCRERFYAGDEAGWGAQVLEQSNCGIVIFADVDLTPAELEGDFAHDGLTEKSELGTVGLWCQLHGEAFLQAGMHHLECTFDFDAAREQLDEIGVPSMAPFADFGYLRQAFTTGEIWQVIPNRVDAAVEKKWLTEKQATKFKAEGTIGSHMEVLERNQGFKGFNQKGVSDIIRKTDPRNVENE
jgi:hypothetical protein